MSDLIDRAQAQTELQFVAKRYTVAHEAHGEGHVVWSDDLISVADAMNALRNVPSAELGTNLAEVGTNCISRRAAIEKILGQPPEPHYPSWYAEQIKELPSAQPELHWIPVTERLPILNQPVLLSTNRGEVYAGHRVKPSLIWQVTEEGRKHWVYDPEAYTNDIDSLPKAEDIAFDGEDRYGDGWLSVTSVNYNDRFAGVTAWMPLPEPYEEVTK